MRRRGAWGCVKFFIYLLELYALCVRREPGTANTTGSTTLVVVLPFTFFIFVGT